MPAFGERIAMASAFVPSPSCFIIPGVRSVRSWRYQSPSPIKRLNPPPSILDPFKPCIDAILTADEEAPRKQRHTASKIWRRLQQEHGYTGGYERVRLYVRERQRCQRETFIPLDHDPGQRLEADFGHIYVDFPDGRKQIPVLVVTWAFSNCPFAIALPTERTEAILHGLVEAFAFFGCVPREVWWDNPTTVAPHLFKGRQRQINERYQALASHYNFEPLFCLVRRPQEKPRVEGRVQFLQQDWATPLPTVKDLDELNAHLRACCLRDRERTQAGQTETIGQRFERDRAQALPAADACVRSVHCAAGQGRQVSDRAFRQQLVQRAARVRVQHGDGQGLRRARRSRGWRPGHRTPSTQLRARRANPRSAALFGGARPQAGSTRSCQRVQALAVAGDLRGVACRPGTATRPQRRRAAIHPRLATFGRASRGASSVRSS